ncbi:ATP-dependent DNA helicase RecG [Alcaligenaceae bacterium CGII-47]|nr:ATP-dependent DNA helicase RecG [Alcaligenaceae bacterium CGII-47]
MPQSGRKVRSKKAGSAASSLALKFERLGLRTAADFIVHLPLRYEDETRVTPIAQASVGAHVVLEGEIIRSEMQLRPRRQLHVELQDDSGKIDLRWLHVYPGQLGRVPVGRRIRARGEVRSRFHGMELIHPLLSEPGTELPSTLTPVYPSTDGLSQASLRKAINEALAQSDLSDTLPEAIRAEYQLAPLEPAIRTLHHPPADVSLSQLNTHTHPAWQRIKFDELLAQQLSLAQARAARLAQRAHPLPGQGNLVQALRASLPFTLTPAQQHVIAQISADLGHNYPMLRLLQGDVGSGKTIVAAFAAAQAISSGAQVAIMVPTEILAGQHYQKLLALLEPLGVQSAWLTGSLNTSERRAAMAAISEGSAQLVIGTQALIQEKTQFHRLGLVILDEQHRFGVGQRLALNRKGELTTDVLPHQLSMSATPIPRTLAMTFFADMDVSIIDSLPPGRLPILTKLFADIRRDEVLAQISIQVRSGRQAYWVCPLVEESETLQLQTAVDTYERLSALLADLRVGLMHGRLPAQEKAATMQAFHAGDIDLLVSTTVIEVGVDVPNATLMVIEHAERFGLAQLHQLRGRVGRGTHESACVLLYQPPLSGIARDRLRAMYETQDGFEIARRDLLQRGPGELLGLRQSGQVPLRFAQWESDELLITQAKAAAQRLSIEFPEHARAHRQRWMQERAEYLRG